MHDKTWRHKWIRDGEVTIIDDFPLPFKTVEDRNAATVAAFFMPTASASIPPCKNDQILFLSLLLFVKRFPYESLSLSLVSSIQNFFS